MKLLEYNKTYKFDYDIVIFERLYNRIVLPNESESKLLIFNNPNKPYNGKISEDKRKFTFFRRSNTIFEAICEVEYLDIDERKINVKMKYNKSVILMVVFQTIILLLVFGLSNPEHYSIFMLTPSIFVLIGGLLVFFSDIRTKTKYIEGVLKYINS